MRQFRNASARLIAVAAIPLAMTLSAGVAAAQYGTRYPDQSRYPAQQQQQQRGYGAQQELFEWSGRVDKEIRIQVDRNNASVIQIGNGERTNGRIRAVAYVPRQEGTVTLNVLEGRGRVDVVQQPNARNGYTAVIRVRDPQGGASRYRIAAYWTPNGNYDNGRRRGY